MLSSLVTVLALVGTSPEPARQSYLFHMEAEFSQPIRFQREPYRPAAGDLILFDDHCKWMWKLYKMCGTAAPLHSGVVFNHPNGSATVLEAGPEAVQRIFVFDLERRLHNFDGTILIRRLKKPLTPEQSQHLTEFCLAQEGKRYALGRLMLQGTPFRPQGPVRNQLLGKTVTDRSRWMCSELTVAAMAAVGVLDPQVYHANAMYPRDLCYDERYNLSPLYHPPALWYPRAELEHIGDGIRAPSPKRK